MAIDMFLKLEGVTGESGDSTHSGEIELLAWSWGMAQSGTTHSATGGGGGKVAVQDLSITKYVDKSSPTLVGFCCQGKHMKTGMLTIRKAGGDAPVEYLTLALEDIIVSSISLGGSGGEDRLTENIGLNFGKFVQTYTPQKADGSKDTAIPSGWDIPANKPKSK